VTGPLDLERPRAGAVETRELEMKIGTGTSVGNRSDLDLGIQAIAVCD
jgi:hypothetical protein